MTFQDLTLPNLIQPSGLSNNNQRGCTARVNWLSLTVSGCLSMITIIILFFNLRRCKDPTAKIKIKNKL